MDQHFEHQKGRVMQLLATPEDNFRITSRQANDPGRIAGYDLARSLAIISMIFVNYRFALVTPGIHEGHWFLTLTKIFPCREAAMFVMLAGMGASLSAWKTVGNKSMVPIPQARLRLIKRAMVLMLIGVADSLFWDADILRFFALYMLAGALFLFSSKRTLAVGALGSIAAFPMLLLFMDYETGWNFATMDYGAYWTVAGFFTGLLYNGHHPFFPWMAFFLVGMVLGRLDLAGNGAIRRNIMLVGGVLALLSELASLILTFA